MASHPQQFLYMADAVGTPTEIVNGARTARNLQNSNLCGPGIFGNIVNNMGCDGYLVQPSAPSVLNDVVGWWDAMDGSLSRQGVPNRGTAGPVLNGQLGASTSASTDDPEWLGGSENYLYTPGVTGNNATLPSSSGLQVSGDIEIVLRVALANLATGSTQILLSKYAAASNGYEVSLSGTGAPQITVRLAGSDVTVASTSVLPSALAGSGFWLKIQRTSSSGSVSFWYSPSDGPTEPDNFSLLSTVAGSSGAIATGAAVMTLGERTGGGSPAAAKLFRAIVRAAIAATTPVNALDVDFTTNTSQSSFTAGAGGVVTINRSSTGRKTVMYLGRPLWLFGTDDFITVPDNVLLDFALNESMTVIAVQRVHNIAVGSQQYVVAKIGSSGAGWSLANGTAAASTALISDGTNSPSASSPNKTAGVLTVSSLIRNATADTVAAGTNSTLSATTADSTTATLSNSQPLRIGSRSDGASFFDGEIMAVLIWRRALSSAEIAAVSAFYTSAPQLAGRCWTAVDLSSTAAPWYRASNPASAEALGFFIEEWTGLDGAHHKRSSMPTGQNRGGAIYGPQSADDRTWKLNVLLMATTERGMEYLFRWLESTLLRCCSGDCDTASIWLREMCPPDPDNAPQEGLARAERVALREGPTWETPPVEALSCYIRRVSFTLSAGDPCLYREPTPLAYNESTTGSASFGATLANCATFVGGSRHTRATLQSPNGYGQVAPIVTITSPGGLVNGYAAGLPALRIAGFIDPLGTGDVCRMTQIGELIIEASGSGGYEIVADLAKRRVRMRPLGSAEWLDGSRMIGRAVRSGLPRWWSIDSCDTGVVVVEPVYLNLSVTRLHVVAVQTPSWTVQIEQAVRFGCC